MPEKYPRPEPPKRFTRFLEWFCPAELSEGILGDLYEQWEEDYSENPGRSQWKYRMNVILFLRTSIILRNTEKNSHHHHNHINSSGSTIAMQDSKIISSKI
jgi:hypothetical protein